MARLLERLSPLEVRRAESPGLYPDGGGLHLQVTGEAGRSWIFRYWLNKKEKWMGLGPLHCVSLAKARELARGARELLHQGLDPLEERRKAQKAEVLEEAKAITFDKAIDEFIEANQSAWRNEKHIKQWKTSLTTYASPHMGKLAIADIGADEVLKALKPIWGSKAVTAGRVRGRIENVLDWATALGYRQGDNPARWGGHLDKILPAKAKVAKVKHHAALPYAGLSMFMRKLAEFDSVSAKALTFTILTAARTGEVLGLEWSEIDLEEKVWTVPEGRMKGQREHRVPLTDPAIAILKDMADRWRDVEARRWKPNRSKAAPTEPTGPVFFGAKAGKGLSNMSMLKVLKTLRRPDLTTHGFRSTFRDWAAEKTDHAGEIVEMALAHVVANKVESAYRRGDLFGKRRVLMEDWAKACAVIG
ncbi:tyrosine-type recombinase/integrase [Caulobacter hibisci]|uniref:Tyrosine-type recombinase/integrase n=1 Tax=Caulobacter hibisci TaxID=2035993 RepID=A0ABS0T0K1_9CAUL|nr:site-specific integrase [Caulobacter hibisci]MBI1685388.1 tyrosine-type recombinase/integrase [Caulobacter hibisci]